MSGERYYFQTPSGRVAIDGTFKPESLSPRQVSHNLVRARNFTEVFDLSDGLPDPSPVVLTGFMEAASEAQLSRDINTLDAMVRSASAFDRAGRNVTGLKGASVVAVPVSDDSRKAQVTITLIPAAVPSAPSAGGDHF